MRATRGFFLVFVPLLVTTVRAQWDRPSSDEENVVHDATLGVVDERMVNNEWSISNSGHISSASGTASLTLTLYNVSLADDGLLIQCSASVNDTNTSTKEILGVQSRLLATSTDMISGLQGDDSFTVTMDTTPSFSSNITERTNKTAVIAGVATVSVLFYCALIMTCVILLRLPSEGIDLSNARAQLSWQRSGIYVTTLIPSESLATSPTRDDNGMNGPSWKAVSNIPATQQDAGKYMVRPNSPPSTPSLRDDIGRKGWATMMSSDLTANRSGSGISASSFPSPVIPLRHSFSSGDHQSPSMMYSSAYSNKPTPSSPLISIPVRSEDRKSGGLSSLSRSGKITASPPPPLLSLRNVLIPETDSEACKPMIPSQLTSIPLRDGGGVRDGSSSRCRSAMYVPSPPSPLVSLRNGPRCGGHKSSLAICSNMSNSPAAKSRAEIYKPIIPSPLTLRPLRDNGSLVGQSQRNDFSSSNYQSAVSSDIPATRPVSEIFPRALPSSSVASTPSQNHIGIGGDRFQMLSDGSAGRRPRPASVPLPSVDVDRPSEPLSPITEQDEAITSPQPQKTQSP